MTAAPKPPVADIAAMKPTGEVYGCVAPKPPAVPTPNLDRVQRYRLYVGGTYEVSSIIEDESGPLWRVDDVRAAIAEAIVAKAERKPGGVRELWDAVDELLKARPL
jgi:hypothetical protein